MLKTQVNLLHMFHIQEFYKEEKMQKKNVGYILTLIIIKNYQKY